MKVDLLCVNYNTQTHLRRFIKTLQRDYDPNIWTLSVADNGSTDGSAEWLKAKAEKLPITNLVLNENIGYSGAINGLAKLTDSDILCAVNADTWFTTKHILDMIQCFQDNPNIAIAGPKQLDEQRRIRHAGIFWLGKKNVRPQHRGWSVYDPQDTMYKDLTRCWTVSGSIYYVRRSVWDEMKDHPKYLKLFPEAQGAFLPTPHFFEETFCSQWAQKLGYEVWYNGLAETAGHTWHASSTPGEASRKYFNTSRSMYMSACDALGVAHEC